MIELKLPYGLRGDELLYIAEVQRGRNCDCVCPACREPLIARKGTSVRHHFAHDKGATCEHGVQTALHMAAKNILATEGHIHLPAFDIAFSSPKAAWRVPSQRIVFDRVQLEKRVGTIVPDLFVYVGQQPLMIEIAVTHRINADKEAKIKQMGISTIEIDISDLSRDFTEALLVDVIVRRTQNKRWIYNANHEEIRTQLEDMSDIRPLIQGDYAMYVEGCPKHSRVRRANVMNECVLCDYCMGIDANKLVCAGRRKIVTYDDLKVAIDT
jgi:hypothetical protein